MATKTELKATSPPRLAVPDKTLSELGLDINTWRVLTDSIFPSAKTTEGVLLAVRYCQARGLDVLKRPVHVVPMWSKALGREIETIWVGINEVQITASRTGEYAGIDPARFGPLTTRIFAGHAKTSNGWEDVQVEVTFPEWCEVTVYRLVNGQRCAFTETVFWEETYSRAGGASTEVPNAMWIKRPRGQLLKCAKAASLRAAFPEEASYTAEEMEGKSIEPEDIVVTNDKPPSQPTTAPAASAAQPQALDDNFKAKVFKLIERAEQANAWKQAEDYMRSRFTGEQLAYALAELEQAANAAQPEAA